jgi:hypothetical protein
VQNLIVCDLAFGRDGDALPNVLYGWHKPEAPHHWSDGNEAAFLLPPLPDVATIFIELTCGTFSRGGMFQRVSIQINAGPATAPVRIERGTFVWQMACPAPPARGVLRFHLPDAGRPSDYGPSGDQRLLAISAMRLRVIVSSPPVLPLRSSSIALGREHPAAAINSLLGISLSDLLLRFESFGDNCEFGLVQRASGLEPLGLLRFSQAFLRHLLRAIETNFISLGDNITAAIEGGEWMARETGYDLRWHTFAPPETPEVDILARERKKIAFLLRKFREDIANNEKIFVIKSAKQQATKEEIMALFLALGRRGGHKLLWITTADGSDQVGSVSELLPGLMHGRIDRFARDDIADDYSLYGWFAVLANAWLIDQGCS